MPGLGKGKGYFEVSRMYTVGNVHGYRERKDNISPRELILPSIGQTTRIWESFPIGIDE